MVRIFTHILASDSGFAPNPFHGRCTLACCKPVIRRTAELGDWVVGITPKRFGHRLAYAMRVEEILTLGQYFEDLRFADKKPALAAAKHVVSCGDNCYERLPDGQFHAHPSFHYKGPGVVKVRTNKDLRGENVLIASAFAYFGTTARKLPANLAFMIPGRGHRVKFTADQLAGIKDFVGPLNRGVCDRPHQWPKGDDSWRQGRR